MRTNCLLILSAICFVGLLLTACEDDKEEFEESLLIYKLLCIDGNGECQWEELTACTIRLWQTEYLKIEGGTSPYAFSSHDQSIVQARHVDYEYGEDSPLYGIDLMHIIGRSEGDTKVEIMDIEGNTTTLNVRVESFDVEYNILSISPMSFVRNTRMQSFIKSNYIPE